VDSCARSNHRFGTQRCGATGLLLCCWIVVARPVPTVPAASAHSKAMLIGRCWIVVLLLKTTTHLYGRWTCDVYFDFRIICQSPPVPASSTPSSLTEVQNVADIAVAEYGSLERTCPTPLAGMSTCRVTRASTTIELSDTSRRYILICQPRQSPMARPVLVVAQQLLSAPPEHSQVDSKMHLFNCAASRAAIHYTRALV
jgi:hypothetical protein